MQENKLFDINYQGTIRLQLILLTVTVLFKNKLMSDTNLKTDVKISSVQWVSCNEATAERDQQSMKE